MRDDNQPKPEPRQTYRIEIRFNYTGTLKEAEARAQRFASSCGGEVTAIFDENYEEV